MSERQINELATNSKNKNITDLYRGINEVKRGYQPRNNLKKGENGDLLGHSYIIYIGRRSIFLLLNIHSVINVRQKENTQLNN
jgi:hypothetical protein